MSTRCTDTVPHEYNISDCYFLHRFYKYCAADTTLWHSNTTLWVKKLLHYTLGCNFTKYWSIFKILQPADLAVSYGQEYSIFFWLTVYMQVLKKYYSIYKCIIGSTDKSILSLTNLVDGVREHAVKHFGYWNCDLFKNEAQLSVNIISYT